MELSKRKFIKDCNCFRQIVEMVQSKFKNQLIKRDDYINTKGFRYGNFYLMNNENQFYSEGILIAQYNYLNPNKSWVKTI